MKIPKYLSPSALACWETDRAEYYMRYLCEQRTPKIAQTRPMAVGSSFDGMVKNAIEVMCKLPVRDYSSQIEAPAGTLRDQALADGKQCLDFYRSAGGISRLLCTGIPRMEFQVQGPVPGTENCVGGSVIVTGKPDMYYKIGGHSVVMDWKINGYCSKASPAAGYVWDSKTKMPYKGLVPQVISIGDNRLLVGRGEHFTWIDQLTTYGWLLGEALGDEFLLQVHQITRDSAGLRLTEHRAFTEIEAQKTLRDRYVACWEAIHSGRCFTDLDYEGDCVKQKEMDTLAAGLQDPVFNKVCGR